MKKLINTQTQKPLVEFQGDKTIIHNKFLEQEMRTMGVPIPHGMRGLFQGKDVVKLDEEDFQRAFQEVYYLTAIDAARFRWEEM